MEKTDPIACWESYYCFKATPDGALIVLACNVRVVRAFIAFSLDNCDREILSYVVSTIAIDGAAIHDLMLESGEYRFRK
jgi:hypothetical protein